MKEFNINHYIYIQITDAGWNHLEKTVGHKYIEHCILPYKAEINNEKWYRLQAHQVFELLPINCIKWALYNTTILINEKDLIEYKY